MSEESALVPRDVGLLSRIERSGHNSSFPLIAFFFPRIYNFLILIFGRGRRRSAGRVAILELVRDPSGRVVQIVATDNEF